jgi:hypothetical protein
MEVFAVLGVIANGAIAAHEAHIAVLPRAGVEE